MVLEIMLFNVSQRMTGIILRGMIRGYMIAFGDKNKI